MIIGTVPPKSSSNGVVLKRLRRDPEARDAYLKALRLYERRTQRIADDPLALCGLGTVREALGDRTAALNLYRRAVAVGPDFPEPHFALGRLLYIQGDVESAEREYLLTIQLRPSFVAAYNELGAIRRQQGRLDDSLQFYETAVGLDSTNVDAVGGLAVALYFKGDYQRQLKICDHLLLFYPRNAHALHQRGLALAMMARLWDAFVSLNAAVRIDEQPDILTSRGQVRELLGLDGPADDDYDRAIALDADFGEAYFYRSRLLLRQGRFSKALVHARKAQRLGPRQAPGWPHDIERHLRLCEQYAGLEARLPRFLSGEDAPPDGVRRAQLALVMIHHGMSSRALKLYEDSSLRNYLALAFYCVSNAAKDDRRIEHIMIALAWAGCGGGQAPPPDEATREDLRSLSHDLFAATLNGHRFIIAGGYPLVRQISFATLHRWLNDPRLAGIRDEAELAKLPPQERAAWRVFWAQVRELIAAALDKMPPEESETWRVYRKNV